MPSPMNINTYLGADASAVGVVTLVPEAEGRVSTELGAPQAVSPVRAHSAKQEAIILLGFMFLLLSHHKFQMSFIHALKYTQDFINALSKF